MSTSTEFRTALAAACADIERRAAEDPALAAEIDRVAADYVLDDTDLDTARGAAVRELVDVTALPGYVAPAIDASARPTAAVSYTHHFPTDEFDRTNPEHSRQVAEQAAKMVRDRWPDTTVITSISYSPETTRTAINPVSYDG